jgi:hypothetical protein
MENELISFGNGLKASKYFEPDFYVLTILHDVPGLRRSVSSFYNLKEDQSKFVLDYVDGLSKNLSYDEVKEQLELIK